MPNQLQIVNLGLIMAGETKISALSDENKKARTANIIYSPILDEVLTAGPQWNFAIKRQALSLETATPVFEYSYQFTKPSGALKLLKADEPDDKTIWVEENGLILCNESSINLKYIFRQTDTSTYSPGFVSCLATRLGVDFALQITQSTTLAEKLFQLYKDRLGQAGTGDAQAGTPEDVIIDDWISARESGVYNHMRTNR